MFFIGRVKGQNTKIFNEQGFDVFKNRCIPVHCAKVTSVLDGLKGNIRSFPKKDLNPGIWVLIREYSARAIQSLNTNMTGF